MTSKVTLLIDLDPAVYRAGLGVEKRTYYLQWVDVDPKRGPGSHPAYDTEHIAKLQYAWRRDELVRLLNLHPDEHASSLFKNPGPLEHSLHAAKGILEGIHSKVGAYLYEYGQQIGESELYLSGANNFRDRIATIVPYKGSRRPDSRPYWYDSIREYYIKRHGAKLVGGMEADDAVSIRQWNAAEGSTIICTIDKDLRMVPGHHYNYMRKEADFIKRDAARLAFYTQLLTGDTSDDIRGLWRVGKGAACVKELSHFGPDEGAQYEFVLYEYCKNIEKYPEKHLPHIGAAASLLENARLLWMLTEPDELWTPPGTPNESIKGYLNTLPPVDPDEDLLPKGITPLSIA